MKNIIYSTIFTTLIATQSIARDNVQVAGSSIILPYASIVADPDIATTQQKIIDM